MKRPSRGRLVMIASAATAWLLGSVLGAVGPGQPAAGQPMMEIGAAHARYVPTLDGSKPIFLLFIGSGARPGDDVEHSLADSIHIVSLNPAKHRSAILGIPRDSWVPIPGHGDSKINAAMVYGGPELLVRTVEQLTGITLNYWVLTTFEHFQSMINDIGGLRVDVPFAMHDHYSHADFAAGMHTLNGRDALAFARDRHSLPNGDFGRSENAGRLIVAALAQFRREFAKDPSRVLTWVSAGFQNVRTTVPFSQIMGLAFTASTINPKHVENFVLQGSTGTANGESIVTLSPGNRTLFTDMKGDGLVSPGHLPPSPNRSLLG